MNIRRYGTVYYSRTSPPIGRTLVYYSDLVFHFVKRNFMLRYKGSALGVLWSVIPPLAHLLILVFVFGKVIPLGIEAYPAYVFASILPWTWFSASVNGAGGVFTGNRDLLRRPDFSPSVLVVVETMLNLLNYLILFPVLIVTLAVYNREITWYLLFFPLLILIQCVLTTGVGLLIATANVFYRDVQHMASLAVMLLFYVTPIFYQTGVIGEKYTVLYKLNPVASLIQGYQSVLFYGRAPDLGSLLLAGMSGIAVCIAGYAFYRRQLHNIFDSI